jgi:hypothetical protein
MSAPTIAVAGLGRCGSSLTLQMLAAAGFPVIGSYPSYEDSDELAALTWHPSFEGRAFKLIDAHRWNELPPKLDLLIWLDRDEAEQAASQIKFAMFFQSMGQITTGTRDMRRQMAGLLRRDRRAAKAALEQIAVGQRIEVAFEGLIRDAETELAAVSDALGQDIDWPRDVVVPRSAVCHHSMLEMQLMQRSAA